MKTEKSYKNTKFSPETIRNAIKHVGPEAKVYHNTVKVESITNSFDSVDEWLAAYGKKFISASLNFEGKQAELGMYISLNETKVEVNSKNRVVMDTLFAIFDAAAPSALVAKEPLQTIPKGVDVDCICDNKPLHWHTLPSLAAYLSTLGIEASKYSITIKRFPMDVTYEEWPPVLKDVQENGEPTRFHIALYAHPLRNFTLKIIKDYYSDSDELYLRVWVSGAPNVEVANNIVQFLGLTKATPMKTEKTKLDRTAFIAHRFDELGEQVADRLARFLTLLGFEVKTGRGFAPKSVSGKVKERLKAQAITFVILSPGADATWLTQESVLGMAEDKQVFILSESSIEFKPGIFGDIEYISFTSPKIESAFISILEGLKEIGFDTTLNN